VSYYLCGLQNLVVIESIDETKLAQLDITLPEGYRLGYVVSPYGEPYRYRADNIDGHIPHGTVFIYRDIAAIALQIDGKLQVLVPENEFIGYLHRVLCADNNQVPTPKPVAPPSNFFKRAWYWLEDLVWRI